MPETIIDLGKKVKAKYPGQYDDLSDDEVGRRVKAKFPGAYDDFTDAPKQTDDFKQPEGSPVGRFLKGAWDTTVGGVAGAIKIGADLARTAASGPGTLPSPETMEAVSGIVKGHADQGRKAKESLRRGNYSEAVGHGIAAALPVVGPAAAHAAEKMGGEAPKLDRYGNVIEQGQAPDIAGGLGEAAGLIVSSSPKNVATPVAKGIAKTGKAVPHRITPEGLYQSSLRPGLSKKNIPKIKQEVATGLREGVTVDRKGLQLADATIDELNQEVARRIKSQSAAQGPVVQPTDVVQRLDDTRAKFGQQVNPKADLAAIDKSGSEFLEKHTQPLPPGTSGPTKPNAMTLLEAQAEKQGTYRQLKDKAYGELKSADIEAQKALARGLKEEIAARVPELKALNAREGALIELQNELERMVAREGNKNVLGLVPATMAHNPYGFLATLLMDNPAIKSRIAIALDRVRKARPSAESVGGAAPAGLAGTGIDENDLPHYAEGGIAGMDGPELAVVGEEGPEAIIPITAEHPTVPEKPETLTVQLKQLAEGLRAVVMFPRGSDLMPRPKGMKAYTDEHKNTYIFNPEKTSQQQIDAAIQNNALPDLLGAAEGGMGAPDKSELSADAVAVVGRDDDGTTTQATVAGKAHVRKAIRQTAKVTPKGGKVSVEPPQKEIRRRLSLPEPGPIDESPARPRQWFHPKESPQWFRRG